MNIRSLGNMAETASKVLEGVFGEANSSLKIPLFTYGSHLTEPSYL